MYFVYICAMEIHPCQDFNNKTVLKSGISKCKFCGVNFKKNAHHQIYCSYSCKKKNALSRYHNGDFDKHINKCLYCGSVFSSVSNKQKYCSSKCSSKGLNSYLYIDGNKRCALCKAFKPLNEYKIRSNGGGRKKINPYCNDCFKSIESAKNYKRRNWTIKTNKVDIIAVFNKHGWKCCDCGIDTPKELRGKFFNNSPELDHILPISLGGEHSYSNVQLLCRKCNITKGNKYAKTGIRTNGLPQQTG